jgi:voltage-gated potassium channel
MTTCFLEASMAENEAAQKKHSSNYDLFILALTLISLVTTLIIFIPGTGYEMTSVAYFMDAFISLIFLFDFFSSLYVAPNKMAYLKWGWMDLLGSLPAYPALRILRVWRIVRLARISKTASVKELVTTVINRPAESTLLIATLFGILLFGFASYFILVFELPAEGGNIKSVEDAVWWVLVTITTVGYGDRFPTTHSGRLIATILMFTGIGLFSVLTSYLSTSFISGADDAMETDIKMLRQEVTELKQMLQKLLDESSARNSISD